jgi:Zn-dependent M28 family amino/carboxypeptidase
MRSYNIFFVSFFQYVSRLLSKIEGNNIMGMFPGTNFGTKTDEITIVVAHWDTVLDSPGFDDNGSGTVHILGQ